MKLMVKMQKTQRLVDGLFDNYQLRLYTFQTKLKGYVRLPFLLPFPITCGPWHCSRTIYFLAYNFFFYSNLNSGITLQTSQLQLGAMVWRFMLLFIKLIFCGSELLHKRCGNQGTSNFLWRLSAFQYLLCIGVFRILLDLVVPTEEIYPILNNRIFKIKLCVNKER